MLKYNELSDYQKQLLIDFLVDNVVSSDGRIESAWIEGTNMLKWATPKKEDSDFIYQYIYDQQHSKN